MTDRIRLRRYAALVLAGLTAVALWTAVRADQPQGDNDLVTGGLQNTVTLTAAPGAAVATSAQLVIERKGAHNLVAGDQVFFNVDASATTLPGGYSVGSVTLTVPTPWDTSGQTVAGSPAIAFTAPATAGTYAYTVQWTASGPACVTTPPKCLTGMSVFTIDLTVYAASSYRGWDPNCPIDGRPRDAVCLPLHLDPKLQPWQRSLGYAQWIEEGGPGPWAEWVRPLYPQELAITGLPPGTTIRDLFKATWGGLAA